MNVGAWTKTDEGDIERGILRVTGFDNGTNLECGRNGYYLTIRAINDKSTYSEFRPGKMLQMIAHLFDVEITVTERSTHVY